MLTMPAPSTQPQLGNGLMVRAKMILAMPSTMKNTISSTVMTKSPLSGERSSRRPIRMASTAEIACSQKCGHVAGADQADALQHAADDQDPGQQVDDGDRGDERIDQGEKAGDHQQDALNQIPERITLHCLAHGLAQHRGSFVQGYRHENALLQRCGRIRMMAARQHTPKPPRSLANGRLPAPCRRTSTRRRRTPTDYRKRRRRVAGVTAR